MQSSYQSFKEAQPHPPNDPEACNPDAEERYLYPFGPRAPTQLHPRHSSLLHRGPISKQELDKLTVPVLAHAGSAQKEATDAPPSRWDPEPLPGATFQLPKALATKPRVSPLIPLLTKTGMYYIQINLGEMPRLPPHPDDHNPPLVHVNGPLAHTLPRISPGSPPSADNHSSYPEEYSHSRLETGSELQDPP